MPSSRVNGSPSISMRSAKVPESPSSALQQMYFCSTWASSTVCHLRPAGNPAPPLPRSPDAATVSTTCWGLMAIALRRPTSPPFASKSARSKRVDHAHARVGQPVLSRQPLELVDDTVSQRMVTATEHSGVQELSDIGGLHGAVADAAAVDVDLDERLEPQHAARSVADDANVVATSGASAVMATATSSAPTARAEESRGTYTVMVTNRLLGEHPRSWRRALQVSRGRAAGRRPTP